VRVELGAVPQLWCHPTYISACTHMYICTHIELDPSSSHK
jgi:hypothetical protein